MKLIVIFLLAILSGCVTYPDRNQYEAKLASLPIETSSIDKIMYFDLQAEKAFEFELGGDHSVYDFGNGKSFYKAFLLPKIESSASIEVVSLFNTVAQAKGHVPYVSINVLNEKFESILLKESNMTQDREAGGSVHFKDETSINHEAKYLIVYVDPKNIEKTVSWYYGAHHMGAVGELLSRDIGAKIGFGGPMRITVKL